MRFILYWLIPLVLIAAVSSWLDAHAERWHHLFIGGSLSFMWMLGQNYERGKRN